MTSRNRQNIKDIMKRVKNQNDWLWNITTTTNTNTTTNNSNSNNNDEISTED